MYKKISDSLVMMGENVKIAAMSREEVTKHLKMLEDPEIAKQVGDALRRVRAGSTIEATVASKLIQTIIMALMLSLGAVFADIPTLKEDLSLKLKGGPVKLEDVNEFKEKSTNLKTYVDDINTKIKEKTGREKVMTGVVRIGNKDVSYSNEYEYNVLKALGDLVKALNKNKHIMSAESYKKMMENVMERAETKSRAFFKL